jgi:hypothetical protein
MDKITHFNERIEKLKKGKLKFQTQQAILFRREAEKLFEKDFKPEIALAVLSEWNTATETKKKEWTNKANSFRFASVQNARSKIEAPSSESHQNGKAQTAENG